MDGRKKLAPRIGIRYAKNNGKTSAPVIDSPSQEESVIVTHLQRMAAKQDITRQRKQRKEAKRDGQRLIS